MRGMLIRVGIDQAFGRWNAPIDPVTNRFVYVPIPENDNVQFHPGLARPFTECIPWIEAFSRKEACDVRLPVGLLERHMHLDPDFDHLTYGDKGRLRGARGLLLTGGDLVAFYAAFRPIRRCEHRLVYALLGLFIVEDVVWATDIPDPRWHENAHTRKTKPGESDIVIRGRRGASGRFERCIPIGEWRSGAYRVRQEVLKAWGGLSVKNGFIQRSAIPPFFLNAERFCDWLAQQNVPLLERNN
jgi:hypothetical protein